jgi:hypothetical protein
MTTAGWAAVAVGVVLVFVLPFVRAVKDAETAHKEGN